MDNHRRFLQARLAAFGEATVPTMIVIGAILVVCGVVLMAWASIHRGRMSDPDPNPNDTADATLEPRHRGLGFLGVKTNWPGLLLAGIGVVLLVWPLIS
jgi:drug/metabolite transporter (DMT)-like permease